MHMQTLCQPLKKRHPLRHPVCTHSCRAFDDTSSGRVADHNLCDLNETHACLSPCKHCVTPCMATRGFVSASGYLANGVGNRSIQLGACSPGLVGLVGSEGRKSWGFKRMEVERMVCMGVSACTQIMICEESPLFMSDYVAPTDS
jgi:hypothetical protein